MELRPAALRFVLEQGLDAVIEVRGGSMEPSVAKGVKVHVAALALHAALALGEIVLLATEKDVLLLHRVMHVFDEDGLPYIVHQGDALDSTFGVSSRRDVLARMTSFDDAERSAPPTPERLDAVAHARFLRRRAVCRGFVAARHLARVLGVGKRPVIQRCAGVIRRAARRIVR